MVHRLMVGLGTVGVERVLIMPAGSGLLDSLLRSVRSRPDAGLPALEVLDYRLSGTADDTVRAVGEMVGAGASALAVLGGDGTSRVVAQACGETPLCALSTGTNNAFPAIREATVAGIATGLVATGAVDPAVAARPAKCLAARWRTPSGEGEDLALVDVAVTREPWVGARALWRPADISEVVVALGEPGGVGLSSLAGLIDPVGRDDAHGLLLRLAPADEADVVVRAPIAPGLVLPVGIVEARRIGLDETVTLGVPPGSLALDGEREIELTGPAEVEITLSRDGPHVIDVDGVMAAAAAGGMLTLRRR